MRSREFLIGGTLKLGSVVSFVLVFLSSALAVMGLDTIALTLGTFGVAVLLFTPLAQTAIAFMAYIAEKNGRMVAISAGVLAILCFAALAGFL